MLTSGEGLPAIAEPYIPVSASKARADLKPVLNIRSLASSGHSNPEDSAVDVTRVACAASKKILGDGMENGHPLTPADGLSILNTAVKTSKSRRTDIKDIISFNLVKNHQRRSQLAQSNKSFSMKQIEPRNAAARQILKAGGWITNKDVQQWRRIGDRKKTPWNNALLARRFNVRREDERRLEFEKNSEFEI